MAGFPADMRNRGHSFPVRGRMQQHSMRPFSNAGGLGDLADSDYSSRSNAFGGFMPPTWAETGVVLRSALLLWLFFLGFALLRASLHALFHARRVRQLINSERRRDRDQRSSSRSPRGRATSSTVSPAKFLASMERRWRALKRGIVPYHVPEPIIARYFGLPRFFLGIIVCILYCRETYWRAIPGHLYIIQFAYGLAILINLFFGFIYSPNPMYYVFSVWMLIECLSIPSLMLSRGGQWLNFNFLQAYCVLVEWSRMEKHDIVMYNYSTLYRLLVNVVFQICTFVFITSCGVQFFEILGDPGSELRTETFQVTWANAVYIAIVTLTTVGYGEFVPYTMFGRLWLVLHIVFATYLVTREISLLIDALKSKRRGDGSYLTTTGSHHVVVTGHVKWEFLVLFVREFLSERENLDTKIIVLTSNSEWSEDEWNRFQMQSSFYDYHLMYLDGSPLREEDLARAQVERANAVFVLADPHRNDPYLEDSDTLKALLTIRNYASHMPMYTMNALHDSSFQFKIAMQPDDVELLDIDRILLTRSRTFGGQLNMHMPVGPQPTADPMFESFAREDGHGARGHTQLGTAQQIELMALGLVPSRSCPQQTFFGAEADEIFPRDEEVQFSTVGRSGGQASVKRRPASSESVCMQQLEMTLLAENVFCNGISTLVTNLSLRVTMEQRPSDPPWLLEYKLGAECGIRFLKLPESLRGVKYKDIAAALYDYGLVVIATRPSTEIHWQIIGVETEVDPDLIFAVISYHDDVARIGELADKFAQEYQEDSESSGLSDAYAEPVGTDREPGSAVAGPAHSVEEQSHDVVQSVEEALISARDSYSSELTGVRDAADHRRSEEPARDRRPQHRHSTDAGFPLDRQTPGGHAEVRARHASDRSGLFEASAQTTRTAIPSRSSKPAGSDDGTPTRHDERPEGNPAPSHEGGSRQSSRKTNLDDAAAVPARGVRTIYSNQDRLPTMKGHVIICLDGDFPLLGLGFLLRRLRIKRPGQSRNVPVVVIHPAFPKNFEREFARGPDVVFLLKGNSLSDQTLEQASVGASKAILIMSSKLSGSSKGSTDSKAIFTVMTLDSILREDAATFVCCLLDDEDSLQFLLSPRHARRQGLNLGEGGDNAMFSSDSRQDLRSFRSATSFPRIPSRTYSIGAQSASPFGPPTPSSAIGAFNTFASMRQESVGGLRHRLSSHGGIPRSATVLTRSTSMRFEPAEAELEDADDNSVQNMQVAHDMQVGMREEMHERSRFASGEMIISSLFSGILVREFAQSGFLNLVRELIGAGVHVQRSWIRQLDIPEAWTESAEGMDGRNYRETFLHLLGMGCISLGLYRSGVAPVRIEFDMAHSPNPSSSAGPSSTVGLMDDDFGVSHMLNTPSAADPAAEPLLRANSEDFDEMYYDCPTTRRRIRYEEARCGENSLPYVYTNPEPYTIVAADDAVFVMCHPDHVIPCDWNMASTSTE